MKNSIYIILFTLLIWTISVNVLGVNREMHYRLQAGDTSLSAKERLSYIDSIIAISPNTTDSLLFVSAELASSASMPDIAAERMRYLINKYTNNELQLSTSKYCQALYMLATAYFKNMQYAEGIDTSLRLLHINKPDSLIYHDINCLTLLIECCPVSTNKNLSINQKTLDSYVIKAEELLNYLIEHNAASATIDNMRKSIIFSKMLLAMDSDRYEEALKWGAEMLHYPVTSVERLALEGNLALIYFKMGNDKMAEEYYKKILDEPAWHQNHAISLGNYMFLLTEQGNPQKAIDLWNSHPEIIELVENRFTHSYLLKRLSYALYEIGNINDSFDAYLKGASINDSINLNLQVSLSDKLFESIESGYNHEAQINKAKNVIYILIVTIVLLIIAIVLFIIKLHYNRRRENKEEENKLPVMTEDNNSKEDSCSKEEESSQISRILQLGCLNETLAGVNSIMENSSVDDHDKLSQIKLLLKEVSLYDDIWEIISLQFEKIHPSFFSILKSRHPDITQGEMRMCAYVMLNMSNKEIAILTRRSTRSVETMRYRISKKLPLLPGETLIVYLLRLSESGTVNTDIS